LLLDAITFNPPYELQDAAEFYTVVAQHILSIFPEIATQVTKTSGKMLLHHTALKSSPCMAINSIKMVIKAHPPAASVQDASGVLPLHWITHNVSCNFELVNYLISAYPKGAMVPFYHSIIHSYTLSYFLFNRCQIWMDIYRYTGL